ncbi:putative late blight resistance protein -like protein R1B-14-like [Capsicum annuum]|nr:putative late blight resistance protein -like protein R1B-14-like [Capsicum annuum]
MFFLTPGDQNIFAWPSLTQATDWVKNYIASFDKQRPIKMVKHEDFLQSVLNAKEGNINQLEKLVEKKEMEYNFNQLVEARKRFDELEVREIKALINLFAVKRAQLDETAKQLNENVETEIDSNDYNDGKENDGHL